MVNVVFNCHAGSILCSEESDSGDNDDDDDDVDERVSTNDTKNAGVFAPF